MHPIEHIITSFSIGILIIIILAIAIVGGLWYAAGKRENKQDNNPPQA